LQDKDSFDSSGSVLVCVFGLRQKRIVAYVPNWVDLNTFAGTIDYAKLRTSTLPSRIPEI